MKYKLITVLKLKCHCLFLDLQVRIWKEMFGNTVISDTEH